MFRLVPSGIVGLDNLLNGGFPEKKSILILGAPGSGKTTLCIQFLYNGVKKFDEPGVLVTFDESPDSIVQNSRTFGMNLESQIESRKIAIIDAAPSRKLYSEIVDQTGAHLGLHEFSVKNLVEMISLEAKEIGAKRIAVDPLTALLLQYRRPFERRRETMKLVSSLSALNCTTLLTSELTRPSSFRRFGFEVFSCDGVIVLDFFSISQGVIRGLQILKLRGLRHDHNLHPYEITERGIEVFSKEQLIF